MHALNSFDYALIRIVPRVEREEFMNAGVILSCGAAKFLDALIHLDETRLLAFAADVDVADVRQHLAIIPEICAARHDAGPIARLSRAERFDWFVAPRSTIIQTSPVHTGLCDDPAQMLQHLVKTMVRRRCSNLGCRLWRPIYSFHSLWHQQIPFATKRQDTTCLQQGMLSPVKRQTAICFPLSLLLRSIVSPLIFPFLVSFTGLRMFGASGNRSYLCITVSRQIVPCSIHSSRSIG
jgi:hypothetical protein